VVCKEVELDGDERAGASDWVPEFVATCIGEAEGIGIGGNCDAAI